MSRRIYSLVLSSALSDSISYADLMPLLLGWAAAGAAEQTGEVRVRENFFSHSPITHVKFFSSNISGFDGHDSLLPCTFFSE